MNRETFVEKLRTGLRGLPQTTVDEVMADYEAHFSEGLQAGRGGGLGVGEQRAERGSGSDVGGFDE